MLPTTSFDLNTVFRTGSFYQLKECTELSSFAQQTLAEFYDADDVYGMFEPCANTSHRMPKLAYRDAALLYLHLKFHKHLPRCFTSTRDENMQRTLAQLVLDGVLEMEWQGKYVSGNDAVSAIYGEWMAKNVVPFNHLSQLSLQAIDYAFHLYRLPAQAMAAKLYAFHTTPLDAVERTLFSSTQAVSDFLFCDAEAGVQKTLTHYWEFVSHKEEGWFSWTKRKVPQNIFSPHSFTYKLYISPAVQHLPAAFQKAVPVLTASDAFQFKSGASIGGILRPDKLIAYFETKEALLKTAASLETALIGFAVQGVPFSSQLDENGLLSWGIDPPQTTVLETEGGSWRTTVAGQLAVAILQAQNDGLSLEEAIPFIRARLYANGINMQDWTMVQQAACENVREAV